MPPADFRRAHAGTPPGTYSDDGAQALVLAASLLAHDGLDLDDFGRRLVDWARSGYCAVDGRVFDIGMQTSRALRRLEAGASAATSGPGEEWENGNGALMRVLPLALWHFGSDDELVALARRQSLPTHGHPRSQLCCALYCLWARRLLLAHDADPFGAAAAALRRIVGADAELELILDPRNAERVGGSGYVVDTIWSARHALAQGDSFARVVLAAIMLGNDTDTTAAVAGGLAGVRYGYHDIPPQACDGLRGAEIFWPIVQGLVERAVARC